jgi:sec-independent protein translocase protein TatB
MFEVGFSEMVLIALVALLVLGPNKLPKLARDVGRWVGRARQMVRQMQDQLDHEARVTEWAMDDAERARTMRNPPPIADVSVPAGPEAPAVMPAVHPAASPANVPAGPDAPAMTVSAEPVPAPLPSDVPVTSLETHPHDRPLH